MLGLKITGIFFVVCASGGAGIAMYQSKKKIIEHIQAVKEFFDSIADFITRSPIPLHEIVRRNRNGILDESGFLARLETLLVHNEYNANPISTALCFCLDTKTLDFGARSEEVCAIATWAGQQIRSTDCAGTVRICGECAADLEGILVSEQEKLKKNARLYQAGGILAGVFITLILF